MYLNKLLNGFNVVKNIIITVLRKRKCVGEKIIEGSELMKTQPCHAMPPPLNVNECKLDIDKEHTHAFKNVKLKIGMWFEKNHLENHFHFSLCNSLCKSFFFFLPIYFLSLSLYVPFSLVVSFFSVPLSIYCFFLHV